MSGEAIAEAYDAYEKGVITSPMAQASLSTQTIQESMRLMFLVRSYQVRVSRAAASRVPALPQQSQAVVSSSSSVS